MMHVKIGPLKYEILPMADDARFEYRGLCDNVGNKIYIDMKQPREWRAITLIHEILHAILRMGGYDKEGGDEKLIRHMASLLYQVLNDNPELWLDTLKPCPTE